MKKKKIFISYNHNDKPIVNKIIHKLKDYLVEIEIWVDEGQVVAGDSIKGKVKKGVLKSDALVLIWSKHASSSEWVEFERSLAEKHNKRIIPCVLDSTELPPSMRDIKFIDFENTYNPFARLVKALQIWLIHSTKLRELLKPFLHLIAILLGLCFLLFFIGEAFGNALFLFSLLAMGAGTWFIFAALGDTVEQKVKDRLTKWLTNKPTSEKWENWPRLFVGFFDTIFSNQHWSWFCFWRSGMFSLLAVLVMTTIAGTLDPESFREHFFNDNTIQIEAIFNFLFIGFLYLNFFPDFLSLFESRIIIEKMSLTKSSALRVLYLFIDLFFTTLIALLSAWIFQAFFYLWGPESVGRLPAPNESITILIDYILPLRIVPQGTLWGVFFYSTFFTSIWVWVYGIAGFMIKLATNFGMGIIYLRSIFDVINKPFRAMGSMIIVVLSIVISTIYFIWF